MLDNANIFTRRREKLREALAARRLDGLIITSAINRFYLSGFELHDGQCDESSGFLLITAQGDDWLFTDSRYELAALSLWPADKVCIYKNDAVSRLCEKLKQQTSICGFEPRAVSWNFYHGLKEKLNGFPPVLTACGKLVENLRMIKEPCEINALEKSFAVNHQTLAWLDKLISENRIGTFSEKNLAWEIEKFFYEHGAEESAFATIVAAGSHAARPHAIPRNVKIGDNTSLLIDLGCRVEDYCSDQTRSWWLGCDVPDFYKDTFRLVREAQQAALDSIKPGIPCAEVCKAAIKVFEKAGQEKFFTHGLGHGVGLQTHEAPALSLHSKDVLEAGMTVTVEPGLYYPDWGGIRWENTVLVEDNGVRIL